MGNRDVKRFSRFRKCKIPASNLLMERDGVCNPVLNDSDGMNIPSSVV